MPSIVRKASCPLYPAPMPKSQRKALFEAALHCMSARFEFAKAGLSSVNSPLSYEQAMALEARLFDSVLKVAGMRWAGDLPAWRKSWIGGQLALAGTYLAPDPERLVQRIGALERYIKWDV